MLDPLLRAVETRLIRVVTLAAWYVLVLLFFAAGLVLIVLAAHEALSQRLTPAETLLALAGICLAVALVLLLAAVLYQRPRPSTPAPSPAPPPPQLAVDDPAVPPSASTAASLAQAGDLLLLLQELEGAARAKPMRAALGALAVGLVAARLSRGPRS